MKGKKLILAMLVILIIAIITIFCFFYYKNQKNGNTTINKSEEDIVNDILNLKSYSAKLNITIETNKNKTAYVVVQKLEDGKAVQEVIQPENIAGVITEYDGTNLKIRNNKLNLETTYQNYQYLVENRLWLDSFIDEYKNTDNTKLLSTENEIILEVQKNENPYNVIKKLYIEKKTGKIEKLMVQDINQKTLVYILYTEIKIS